MAMMPSRMLRVTGEQMRQYFDQSKETTELRAVIAEHILDQHRARYIDLHRTTPCERYERLRVRRACSGILLMQRCPGIVGLDLKDIASFLRSTSGRFAMQRTSPQHHQQDSPRHHIRRQKTGLSLIKKIPGSLIS